MRAGKIVAGNGELERSQGIFAINFFLHPRFEQRKRDA